MTGERDDSLDQVSEELLRAGMAWVDGLSRATRALTEAAPMAQAAPGQAASGQAAPESEGEGRSEVADLMTVAARAQLALAAAGLDYSRRLVDLQARRAPRVGGALFTAFGERGLSETERRVLIDEMRGYMREIATVTMDEASHVARALSEIDRTLAAAVGDAPGESAAAAAPHARRWRAKE